MIVKLLSCFIAFSSTLFVLGQSTVAKKIIVEELTGTWCGFCPNGNYILDSLSQQLPYIIPVAIHVSDPMANASTLPISQTYSSGGVNVFLVDRYLFESESFIQFSPDYETLHQKIQERAIGGSTNTIAFHKVTLDTLTRTLSVTLSATFQQPMAGYNLRTNLWIVEDSIQSSTSGYEQVNYYNGLAGHPYEGVGNPIPNFVHRHVLRKIAGSPWGQRGSIPVRNIRPHYPYVYTYTLVLDESWDLEQLYLIGLVQRNGNNHLDKEILNAEKISLQKALTRPYHAPAIRATFGRFKQGNVQLEPTTKVYPNPFQEEVFVDIEVATTTPINISVFNQLGAKVRTIYEGTLAKGQHDFSWNGKNEREQKMAGGLYFIQVEKGDNIEVYKAVLK